MWVEAPNPDGRLRPGTAASIAMVAQTINDAIVVPASALLKTPEGANQVMIVNNGHAHQVASRLAFAKAIGADHERTERR